MWILIAITIATGPNGVSGHGTSDTPHVSFAEFDTLRACNGAAEQIRKTVDARRLRMLCVPKGETQTTTSARTTNAGVCSGREIC